MGNSVIPTALNTTTKHKVTRYIDNATERRKSRRITRLFWGSPMIVWLNSGF